MRLLSFKYGDQESWGALTESGVIDMGARYEPTLLAALQSNDVAEIASRAAGLSPDCSIDEISYLAPVTAPEKVICIGVNYANRNAEYRDNSADPEYPSVFMRTIDSFASHDAHIWRPPESHQLDYEGEIGIVIGKGGHRIAENEALSHIAGLTVVNEGTLRDWVRHAKFNVTQGKNFVRSGGIGPWVQVNDGRIDFDNLTVTTRVNGEQRQHDTTANLMFPFAYLISYLSRFFILKAGDVIATGTPLGAGARFEPPRYLIPGDTVEVEVSGVGVLRNTIADDPLVS